VSGSTTEVISGKFHRELLTQLWILLRRDIMDDQMTADTIVDWLAGEAHKWAQMTANGKNPDPYLWSSAVDALYWLRKTTEDEREKALQAIKECLDELRMGNVSAPSEQYESECFITLLQYVYTPPPVL
jgi:hypothetical protein